VNLFFVTRWSVVFSVYSGFLHHQNWLPRYDCNIVESGVKHHYPLSGMHSVWSLHRRSDVMYREGIFFPLRGEIIGFVCVIICMHSRWSLHKRVLVKPQRSITLDLLMMFRFKARVINNCIPTLYQVICFPVFYSYIILVFSSLNHEHNLRENLSIFVFIRKCRNSPANSIFYSRYTTDATSGPTKCGCENSPLYDNIL
jgi:hypothetical protein